MLTNNKLFSEFPPVETDEWKEKIVEDLKGADYDKKMIWKTNEGFNVNPFYRKEDVNGTPLPLPGEHPYTRGNRADNKWLIRTDISVGDAVEANRKAKKMISEGTTSIGFKIKGDTDIEQLLAGIDPQATEINFSTCQKCAAKFAQKLVLYYKEQGYAIGQITGSIDYDPLGKALCKGVATVDCTSGIKEILNTTAEAPLLRPISVNSAKICNSGAYITQELGCALAWGNEYLSTATEAGIASEEVAKKIKFNMGISSNFFMEIAKFRAARMLWAKIVEQYTENKEAGKMVIHAETTAFNLTLFDPYVNMLRTQTEAMSAAIAGVESITVRPYDSVYETPTEFAERIAKNQQLILKHESHIDVVADPAGGSYYIESLTASIASQAWKLFLDIENNGGFAKAVETGYIKNMIEKSGKERLSALARRKEILLGTNQYPNFTETAGGRTPVGKACDCGTEEGNGLRPMRLGEEFELLRLATEASGRRPKAFMLTIGNLAMRQARAQFSSNFLAAAGYEIIDNLGFKSIEEGAKAAIDANAEIVVICSSDDEYAEYAIPAYQAVKEKAIFIVAGAPACTEDLQKAGIENFIHVRVNVLETLKALNAKLGL